MSLKQPIKPHKTKEKNFSDGNGGQPQKYLSNEPLKMKF